AIERIATIEGQRQVLDAVVAPEERVPRDHRRHPEHPPRDRVGGLPAERLLGRRFAGPREERTAVESTGIEHGDELLRRPEVRALSPARLPERVGHGLLALARDAPPRQPER